jgi:hypothetical protein
MAEEDYRKIATAVSDELSRHRTIDVITHKKHLDYIDTLISAEKTRAIRKEQWIRTVGGWGIIVLLGGFVSIVWQYAKEHIK